MQQEKCITKQFKSDIDDNFSSLKVNVTDPTKDKFTQPLSIKEILDELGISKDDYYTALSISEDQYEFLMSIMQ